MLGKVGKQPTKQAIQQARERTPTKKLASSQGAGPLARWFLPSRQASKTLDRPLTLASWSALSDLLLVLLTLAIPAREQFDAFESSGSPNRWGLGGDRPRGLAGVWDGHESLTYSQLIITAINAIRIFKTYVFCNNNGFFFQTTQNKRSPNKRGAEFSSTSSEPVQYMKLSVLYILYTYYIYI